MSPAIGITTYHREGEGRPRFTLPTAYVDAVRRAGGLPLLLTPGEARLEDLVARLDGIVLTGGGDLDPELAGVELHPATYFTCAERDRFELSLVRAALARGVPTLAICRGLQVLNVALGGDVHVHVPDAVGEAVPHRVHQDQATEHPVELGADSRLAGLLGTRELGAVASWHHQAVRTPGRGLRPVAWAADGIVEALELDGSPGLVAVQWHPELQPDDPLQCGLFDDLVERARG